MTSSNNKPFLSAALFFLLSVLASSHTISHVAANHVFLADTGLSSSAIPNAGLVTPEGDNPGFHRASDWVRLQPPKRVITSLAKPVAESAIAFTVSQARAPPQR